MRETKKKVRAKEEEVEGDEVEGEDEDAIQADLDDEVPDADDHDDEDEDDEPLSPAAADGGWVYDTRREPDTDDEDQLPHPLPPPRYGVHSARRGRGRHATVAGVRVSMPGSDYEYDEREAHDLEDSMLDGEEDAFGPNSTRSRPHAGAGEHDLDADVPEAEDDQAWEHTDTELEESEMDISILPSQIQTQQGRSSTAGTAPHNSARTAAAAQRSSGPWITSLSPAQQVMPRHRVTPDPHPTTMSAYPTSTSARSASSRAARIVSGNRQRPYRPDPARTQPPTRQHLHQTPAMLDSPLDLDEDLEEVDTDIDVETPEPLIAPEHARAIAQAQIQAAARGRIHAGRNTNAAAAQTQTQPAHAGVEVRGNGSPSRTAAARQWLDGAREAVVGGSGSARTNTIPTSHKATKR